MCYLNYNKWVTLSRFPTDVWEASVVYLARRQVCAINYHPQCVRSEI